METRFLGACGGLGDETLVRDLIRQGVNINCKDVLGRSGLKLAVIQGHLNIVKFLL